MTKSERRELVTLAREREKIAKRAVGHRGRELIADFEEQLAREYRFDEDEVWATAMRAASDALAEASRAVKQRCAELGIPEWAAPEVDHGVGWYRRGENAVRERRAELRAVATTRIKALEAEATGKIEAAGLAVQTHLLADGLESAEARSFLETMPAIEDLMPVLPVAEIERAVGRQSRRRDDW